MLRILSTALVALAVIILFVLISLPTQAQPDTPATPAGEWAGGKECHFYAYAKDSYCIAIADSAALTPTAPPPTLDPTFTAPTATPTPYPTNTPRPTPTPVRVQIEVLTAGSGAVAAVGDTVVVHYTVFLTDGTQVLSSRERGEGRPDEFELGEDPVIQGFTDGIVGMRVGEKRKLTIPPELAYGDQGSGRDIPPGATVVFEVELLELK